MNTDESWTYPASVDVLKYAGLLSIEEYIQKRRRTIMRYASETSIYKKCIVSLPLANNPKQLVWWILTPLNYRGIFTTLK
jgi:hypothetical protein